eukprot:CAMPEP_0116130954 /NCGR_PEP_ID=MMETSP0329-20121206/8750_1 /TAXON_ID=697910 /ORGANISM="Pseudo-nitzschia arenysensis, Strain B593" /LENGTH=346 /DNA_ID=CAMNT_0003625357 /DNA_START=264 /DNA_END=1304 /DNA_ORIENTATION=-
MGAEEMASSQDCNVSASDFAKSSDTIDDHSNPQQGSDMAKATMTGKHDHSRQNENDRDAKSSGISRSNYGEDTRKLFVGGLPTDITDPEFRHFFSQFGELQEAVVMFDRVTRRSRGFGFVTYANPDVSRSLLQMGNQGDGIGRLVMRGKTCEVKAAAPRGQAPSRGGKGYRNNRNVPRNQQQAQSQQVPSFVHHDQFPAMYQNDNFNVPYPQGVYATAPGVQGYAPPIFHQQMQPPGPSQPHSPTLGPIPVSGDRNVGENGFAGASYYYGSLHGGPPPTQHTFPHAPQIPGHYQQGYAFFPYIPDHAQAPHPVMENAAFMQPPGLGMQNKGELNSNNEVGLEVEEE